MTALSVLVLVFAAALAAPAYAAGAPHPVLGILVEFDDQRAQTTAAAWRARFFGRADSVRTTLGGVADITPAADDHGTASDGIVGWLTLHRRHPAFDHAVDVAGPQLAHEAVVAAAHHVRFADFDTDGDGVLSPSELLVVIIIAGHEASFEETCGPAVAAHHGDMAALTVDGVQLSAYAMSGEILCTRTTPPAGPAAAELIAYQTAALLGVADDIGDVEPPAAGEYTLVVPNGGERWTVGSVRRIEWQSSRSGNLRAELSRDGGATWTAIFSNLLNDGSQNWTVTGPATNRARFRICSLTSPSICDVSNATFVIHRGTLRATVPNGGETWSIGSIQRIGWTSTVTGKVRIELSRDQSTSWIVLFDNVENDGVQDWTVTGPVTSQARIRVCSVATPRICDISDATFMIAQPPPPAVNLVAPLVIVPSLSVIGGQPWVVGAITGNVGRATAAASRTDIYLSSDATFTTSDLRMASFSVPALGPGEVNEQAKTITFPVISPGLYYIAARVDVLGAVPETDENNWFALPSEFRVFVFESPFAAEGFAVP
jgi:CARDB